MIKRVLLFLIIGVMSVCALSGCMIEVSSVNFSPSKAGTINDELEKRDLFDVKYSIEKSLKYTSKEKDSLGKTTLEQSLIIKNAKLKLKKPADEKMTRKILDFSGTAKIKADMDKAVEKFKFVVYNNEDNFYEKKGDEFVTNKKISDSDYSDYSRIDKLPSQFYTESYIERIVEITYSNDTKIYMIEYYAEDKDDKKNRLPTIFNAIYDEMQLKYSSSSTKFIPKTRTLEVRVNKEGLITKQIVDINFEVDGYRMKYGNDYVDTKGVAKLKVVVDYTWQPVVSDKEVSK